MSNVQLYLCVLLSVSGLCVADPEAVYGNKGSSFTFICPHKKTSADNVVWDYSYNASAIFIISDGEYIANSPIKNRASIVGNRTAGEYNLELRQLQESDEVVYRCSAGVHLKEYKLELLAPPSLLSLQDVTDNKIRGTEGQTLTLRCTATGGKPPPLVAMTVDNVLRSANQTVAYTIPTLQRRHDGQIVQCNANSSALTSPLVSAAALDLYLKPLQPIFSQDPISTEETKPLVVSCTSYGSRPAATFQWTIGWMNVTSNSTSQATVNTADNTYTVTSTLRYNVDMTYNRQIIACTAVNVAAYNVNTSRILDVKFAPEIYVFDVTYSQNNPTRTVTCNIIGNPTTYTYYKWQHKSRYGVLIRELDGGQILTLPSVPVEARYQDSGEYVCTASNGITGRDGKINQTGSGYVTVNAQPTFTNGNKYTEYVVFGSDVDIHVHVYSFPKYTSVIWYKGFMQILQTDKYTLSESKAIVNDTFYGTLIQLDGYRVTLTIKNSEELDVNVSYRVEMFNGVGQPVKQTTLLLSVSAPQTPINFTVLRSSASSIVVQWEAGYNGGYEQTFYLQFRRFGSSSWVAMKIPVTEQTGIQTFTVSELQDGILFELMMYAENMFKRSLPTETKTIATIKDSRFFSTEVEKWGIAGGLSAVIIIMVIIIITLLILRKKGTNRRKSKGQYSRWNEKTAYSMPMDGKESEGNADLVEIDKHNKTIIASAKEYETLGLKDNPNTYSEILTQQGQKQSETSTQEYETLGMVDYPNTYSELNRQPDIKSSSTEAVVGDVVGGVTTSVAELAILGLCGADPEAVFGITGSSIILICPYKDSKVKWSFVYNESNSFTISQGTSIANTQPFGSRVSIVGDNNAGEYNLQLSGLQESDQGLFQCNVGVQLKQYELQLLAPPSSLGLQDIIADQKIIGTEGKSLTLRCSATGGKPPPLVTIIIDNNSITSSQSVEYAIATLQRHHDRQMVRCEANNTASNSALVDNATLYLYLKPLQPTLSPEPVITEEGKALIVSCTSTGSRPQALFKWIIGQATITSGSTTTPVYNTADDTYNVTSTLTYTVDRAYNGQTITCGAYNNVSTSGVVTSKILDVKYAPDVTVTNITYNQDTDTRLVTCIPVGNPTTYTYYRWQHKSTYGELIRELVGEQNGVLTLPSIPVEARYQDSGEYVCTAGNGITGRDGKIQQTGSGYVTVNAMPEFTNGNKKTEYGEFGKDVDIHVYVYSRPKYTSLSWYKTATQISMTANKYILSEAATVITDTFHGTMLQLDGYRFTLTIKNLVESDFNVSYRVELSNSVGQPVVYTTLLVSASHPHTPSCFTVPSSSESSVLLQWEPGYNGGYEQTFYAEYRQLGSNTWISVKIPDTKQTGRQNYTLNGLQDGTLYELRMYAENKINKSLPTEIITIKTIKDCKLLSSSEAVIGGVSGGLSAVIVILIIIIVVLILRTQGTRKQRSTAHTSRWKDETSYHNYIDCKETDEKEDTQAETDKLKTRSAQEYESLGMKDNPSTYSELLTKQDTNKTRSAPEYETLGMTDNPDTYLELHDEQGQKQSENNTDLYESLSDQDKSTVCLKTKAQLGPTHSEYTSIKM